MLMRILSALLILSLVNTCKAQTCQEVLNNCDKAYQAQKQLINDQDSQINNYLQKDQLQHQIIDDQQKKLDSPLSDPVKVALGTAVILTIVEISLGAFRR